MRTASHPAVETDLEALRAQVQQLAALDKLKSDYVNLAAHELRSPLAIIHGYLSMIESGVGGEVPPMLQRLLDPVIRNVDLMSQLVNELVESARLDEPQIENIRELVDVRELIEEAVAPVARSANHQLRLELGESPVLVVADRAQLLRVLANLVDNALKYSPHGGEISAVLRRGDGDVEIDIIDPGIGIAEADQTRLFTRFGRILNEETKGIAGTGLGLYLCRELVRRHGGEVTASPGAGAGSRFTVRLPRGGAAAPAATATRVTAG